MEYTIKEGKLIISKKHYQLKKVDRVHNFSRNEEKEHEAGPSFLLRSLKSPPQTVPEDLRVQRWVVKLHIWG